MHLYYFSDQSCNLSNLCTQKNIVFRKTYSIYLRKFISNQIDEAKINQQLSVLLELGIKTEEYDTEFNFYMLYPSKKNPSDLLQNNYHKYVF